VIESVQLPAYLDSASTRQLRSQVRGGQHKNACTAATLHHEVGPSLLGSIATNRMQGSQCGPPSSIVCIENQNPGEAEQLTTAYRRCVCDRCATGHADHARNCCVGASIVSLNA
jgi:hypothetical protein